MSPSLVSTALDRTDLTPGDIRALFGASMRIFERDLSNKKWITGGLDNKHSLPVIPSAD